MRIQLHGIAEVFIHFLKLGCTAFGGPVAHLGYFQEEFVRRRKWLNESEYADLVALCQFLPGPASSQAGFAIGLKRAGIGGAFAAWLAFTLPSAILMIAFAVGLLFVEDRQAAGWITGLKLTAVAVVANAIWNMAAKLCPDAGRALLALACAAFLLVVTGPWWQAGVILAAALAGLLLFKGKAGVDKGGGELHPGKGRGWPLLVAFFCLLLGLPVAARISPEGWLEVIDGFYRAGSLVFGGGHVVLPLLDTFTVGQGWIDRETFLAGYGAAQAIPGPLFSFSAFLGSSLSVGPVGVAGGVLALLAIYLPSWLLVLGVLPYWERLRRVNGVRAALTGANAAVVGLLLAAFYDPVWTAAVTGPDRLAFAIAGFGLLRFARMPPWALVLLSALIGAFIF